MSCSMSPGLPSERVALATIVLTGVATVTPSPPEPLSVQPPSSKTPIPQHFPRSTLPGPNGRDSSRSLPWHLLTPKTSCPSPPSAHGMSLLGHAETATRKKYPAACPLWEMWRAALRRSVDSSGGATGPEPKKTRRKRSFIMFTLKRQRLVKVLLIGLPAGSILAANAPTASAGGPVCSWDPTPPGFYVSHYSGGGTTRVS